jgi:succinate dehydrogenase / fumarate reductase cytochrome b subunit
MEKALTLTNTTVGKKALLALTGLILFGFVVGHALGNLQVFLGPEVFNHYAESLKAMPLVLWTVRALVFGSVVIHTILVVDLYARSIAARPVPYRVKHNIATSYAASAMKYSGPALLLYILFHIAHFTYPGLALGNYTHSPTDVYHNFVQGFSIPWVTLLYVTANLFLGLHLYHGSFSLFRSLGFSHPRYDGRVKNTARAIALFVTTANVVMPLSVLLGIVQ